MASWLKYTFLVSDWCAWNVSIHSNFPKFYLFIWNTTFHAAASELFIVALCAVALQYLKIYRKCPHHPSSSCFPTTAAERNRVSTGCYFFACLVFSPHDMNVFLTDFIVENIVTHVQGFSSGILIIYFEKLCDKLCVKCEGILINVWLPCMVNMQNFVRYTTNVTHLSKYFFHKLSKTWKFGVICFICHLSFTLFPLRRRWNLKEFVLTCG